MSLRILRRGLLVAVLAASALAAAGCASAKPSNNPSRAGKGFRTLEATVTARQYNPPGSPGTTMSGSGTWILDFEAKDGEALAHFRFEVSRGDYNRYHEGDTVLLVMADDRLREIRPHP